MPVEPTRAVSRTRRAIVVACALLATLPSQAAGRLTIAAASNLKFAMDELVGEFQAAHPGERVDVVYGSSGKFHAQILNGAPFDLFFSADMALPQDLVARGLAASPVRRYATGQLVIWSAADDATKLSLADLAAPRFTRIAIANPAHAPYGQRAVEALRAAGVWETVEPRLVYGENVAQTAQFVESGNATVGIIPLSLARNPALATRGRYVLVPDTLHEPLAQGFIITQRAAGNTLAAEFARYMESAAARQVLTRYGFAPAPPAVD